jgi:hypothetical protein
MEFLLYSASRSLLNLVVFADKIAESGKMNKNRLIFPGYKRLKKFFTSLVEQNDVSNDAATFQDVNEGTHQVYMGASYYKRKNPEHLDPENTVQKLGDVIRRIPEFFKSSASSFGFRVACATISLAIPLFLRRTQHFSNTWRLLWAVIMAAISMAPTSGQSVSGFLLRTLGSFLAMIAAWLIWYIPGNGKGNVVGIIVLFWFFASLGYYLPMKRPPLAQASIITIITITLIIGYELEAKKVGGTRLASTGQTYLPIYEFGPVRLASVLAGLFVAFFWTIFPYPISEHSIIRGDLGRVLYLLATYYSIVHQTVATKFRRDEGDMTDKNGPGRQLQRARQKMYNKQLLLLAGLKQYSAFAHWEIPIGGKFPHKQYDTIIASIEQ